MKKGFRMAAARERRTQCAARRSSRRTSRFICIVFVFWVVAVIASPAQTFTLNGQYAFTFTGYQSTPQTPFVVTGSLTLNSNGSVTGGEYDNLSVANNGGYQFATVTGGSYSISSDGLGQIMFTDNLGGNVQLLIAL